MSETLTLTPDQFPTPAGSRWEKSGVSHWRLVRFDSEWRLVLRQATALRSLEVGPSSWEFVTDSPYLAWTGRWFSRRPEMRHMEVVVDEGVVTSTQLKDAQEDTFFNLFQGLDEGPHHVRIYFPATTTLELCEVKIKTGTSLVPRSPSLRWCSWGDSITQGTLCPSALESYVQLVCRQLGWTAINRGFGGAGCPDPMTALAIACTQPWDILTIAIGVNSAALGLVTPEEFGLMYRACLDILYQRCPGKPIVCISPILCTRELTETGVAVEARVSAIRQVIHESVEMAKLTDVSYVDGLGLLDDGTLLVDGVHPSPAGHLHMADRLAPRLAGLVENL
jgi:lysophospholipase L1-like esterase